MASISLVDKQDWSLKRMIISSTALGTAMLFGMAIGSMPALTQILPRVALPSFDQAPPNSENTEQTAEERARREALRVLADAMKTLPAPETQVEAKAEAVTKLEPQDMQKLAGKAAEAIRSGDIASARLVLQHAVRAGDATALYALAETYDPRVLVKLRVQGMQGEPETARQLYQQALERGVEEARARL